MMSEILLFISIGRHINNQKSSMSDFPPPKHIYTYSGRVWKPHPMIQVSNLGRRDFEYVYARVDMIMKELMSAPVPADYRYDVSCKPYWLTWNLERCAALMAENRYREYLRDLGYESEETEDESSPQAMIKRRRLQ